MSSDSAPPISQSSVLVSQLCQTCMDYNHECDGVGPSCGPCVSHLKCLWDAESDTDSPTMSLIEELYAKVASLEVKLAALKISLQEGTHSAANEKHTDSVSNELQLQLGQPLGQS
ncbi:hypothetical protein FRC12_012697 [Ceratobasidium sp. 428]|nr:hypothetical protein FRC12_012697 [Ceratobasidium sp. 428]